MLDGAIWEEVTVGLAEAARDTCRRTQGAQVAPAVTLRPMLVTDPMVPLEVLQVGLESSAAY